MKLALLTCGVLFALASGTQAADVAVHDIPPFPASCSATPYGETCLHAFGGVPTRIPLPPPYAKGCAGTQLQLYQLSTRLAAPVGQPVVLTDKDCTTVVFALPEVKSTTVFRISPMQATVGIKAVLVQVYPNNLWDDLREWSASHHLVVNDRDNYLMPTLERRHISYSREVLSSELPMNEQVCVWVPTQETVDEGDEPFTCKALIVLHEKSLTIPYIVERNESGYTRADVFMPFLSALDSNPLVQEVFMRLIKSQL